MKIRERVFRKMDSKCKGPVAWSRCKETSQSKGEEDPKIRLFYSLGV